MALSRRPGLRQRGFTFIELLFVTATVGVMFTVLVPALQSSREYSRRSGCANKLRKLASGHLSHASSRGGFLPMAKFWWNSARDDQSPGYGDSGAYPNSTRGPGGWYDDYGWYFALMPYIGEAEVLKLGDLNSPLSSAVNYKMRTTKVALHACPSDLGLQRNEFVLSTWARLRGNYVVNAGNTIYGQGDLRTSCPGVDIPRYCAFGGAPFGPIEVTPRSRITDGLSHTLLMSEVLVLPATQGWGGPYSINQDAGGGQVFTGWTTPNSTEPDALARMAEWFTVSRDGFLQQGIPLPAWASTGSSGGIVSFPISMSVPDPTVTQDSNGVKQQRVAARSHHPNGVNASRCEGSVQFFSDSIDPVVWSALTTAQGNDQAGESPVSSDPEPKI